MRRSLRRMGLPSASRLEAKGVRTAKDLFDKNEYELIELLDVDAREVVQIIEGVCNRLVQQPKTAWAMLRSSTEVNKLRVFQDEPTTVIPSGTLTEFVGPAGVGKTQCCMMLAARVSLPLSKGGLGGGVIYVDTEKTFAPSRIFEMAEGGVSVAVLKEALKNVTVLDDETQPAKLLEHIKSSEMQNQIIQKNIKLIVVDSVANPVRKTFAKDDFRERHDFLSTLASALKFLATAFNIPVVVTNQVTTKHDSTGEKLEAALGVAWAHAVNTRFVLDHMDDCRRLRIVKSPLVETTSFLYDVNAQGLTKAVSDSAAMQVEPVRNGTVVDDDDDDDDDDEFGRGEGRVLGMRIRKKAR